MPLLPVFRTGREIKFALFIFCTVIVSTIGHVTVGSPMERPKWCSIYVDKGKIFIIMTRQIGNIRLSGAGVQNIQRYCLIGPLVRRLGTAFSEGLIRDIRNDNGQWSVEPVSVLITGALTGW